MHYYIMVNGKYLVSPAYGVYELSDTMKGTYLWTTQADAENDPCWKHLVKPGDDVKYVRIYKSWGLKG